ncbi:MAG: carboxypeptidase-like regulatory domain-containing protein, partial [Bacteroidota bacterium]
MKHFYLIFCVVLTAHVGTFGGKRLTDDSGSSSVHRDDGNNHRTAFNVSGRVSDEKGAPFPGVNIVVKGTTQGTATDSDGKYFIEVPDESSILVFSFVGYAGEEIAVAGRSVIDVSMKPDVAALDEIVVTALGIEKSTKSLGYAT